MIHARINPPSLPVMNPSELRISIPVMVPLSLVDFSLV